MVISFAEPWMWLYVVAGIALLIAVLLLYDAAVMTPPPPKHKPRRILCCDVETDVNETLAIILAFARENGYCLEVFDHEWNRLVLSDKVGLRSWGFFYFIYLNAVQQGGSHLEVGICSRLLRTGSELSRRHRRCFYGIKAAVFLHRSVHNSVDNQEIHVDKAKSVGEVVSIGHRSAH